MPPKEVDELNAAAEVGDVQAIQAVMRKGVLQATGPKAQRALCTAAHKGHLEVVQVLQHWGVSADTQDDTGRRPLHLAAEAGHAACVKLLLSLQADVAALDGADDQALKLALQTPHLAVVKELLRYGAELSPNDQAPGLAGVLREIHLEKLTAELIAVARTTQPATRELLAADEEVWKAMREHMRLTRLQEEQKAGEMLISLQRELQTEQAVVSTSRDREESLASELNEKRVAVQTTQTELSEILKALEKVKVSELAAKEDDSKLDRQIKERKGELDVTNAEREENVRVRKEKEEHRDATLAECKALEKAMAAQKLQNDELRRDLTKAANEISQWREDKSKAAALTEQAHRLLG